MEAAVAAAAAEGGVVARLVKHVQCSSTNTTVGHDDADVASAPTTVADVTFQPLDEVFETFSTVTPTSGHLQTTSTVDSVAHAPPGNWRTRPT